MKLCIHHPRKKLNNKQNPKKEFFRKTQIEFVLKAYKPTLMEKPKNIYQENEEN
jgi:hypothetical protein